MTDFSKGKWIEWTGSDDEGTFAHVGQVIASSKSFVTFAVPHGGELTVQKSDGSFKNVRKRKSAVAAIGENVRKREVAKKAAERATGKAPSVKMMTVITLLKEHKPESRKAAIALIVEKVGMSAGGASTYYNTARKHV